MADGLHRWNREGTMALATITRQGLVSIAILVAILWGCVFAERRLTRSSRMETYRALRDIRYLKLKRHIQPAATPMPASNPAPSIRPILG